MTANIPTHKVFISYHHLNDQFYKNELIRFFDNYVFIDSSVDTGDIDENLSDERIRMKIRDEYLRNTSVTILLVGTDTKHRKHIDWEIYSSMFDGTLNKKSGILIINLPTINQSQRANSNEEKEIVAPNSQWQSTTNYETTYPFMPQRIIDNLKSGVPITVINYSQVINNPTGFKKLIDIACNRRVSNNYDLSRPMRRHNG